MRGNGYAVDGKDDVPFAKSGTEGEVGHSKVGNDHSSSLSRKGSYGDSQVLLLVLHREKNRPRVVEQRFLLGEGE